MSATARHEIQTVPDGQFSLEDIGVSDDQAGHASPLSEIPPGFYPEMSLAAARQLLASLLDEGQECPCCSQGARIWRRRVSSTMAWLLIEMYRRGRRGWVYLPDIPQKSRDGTHLALWDLIEEETAVRREDGGRAGWWRVTQAGESFLLGHSTIPKYARTYAGVVLGRFGDSVSIRDCFNARSSFRYDDLMAGI